MRSSTFQLIRLAVLLPMLLACAETSRGANAEPAPPNVVLIISDDQAWGDYSFMGHPHVETPNLDRFASQSLTFMRGYVPSSLCRPSLATIVTGLYPHQHGITGNDPSLKGRAKGMSARKDPRFKPIYEKLIHRIEEHPTLPRLLKEQGYLSLQTGKWWEGQPQRGGFTHAMTHGDPARGGRHGDEGLMIGRKGLKPIYDFIDEAKRKKRPFFLWYAPFLPHAPHTPPERLLKKYRAKAPTEAVARYWAMCEWFDETCGDLLKHLDQQDLAENTLVLYVTDNGWIQQPQKPNRYAPRSKRSAYEGGIRTPIMVRFPGRVEPRKDDTSVVCSIDLAPTILSACGLKKPREMRGVDLLDREAVGERKVMFGEVFEHDVPDVDQPTTGLTHRWMIEGRWKLIVPNRKQVPDGRTELFDLIKDPHEKTDLSAKEPDRVAAMTRQLDKWWKPSED